MRIVVYGLAKTGTSALFYKIRNSLPGANALFEPATYGLVRRLRVGLKTALTGRRHPDTLAKVILFAADCVGRRVAPATPAGSG
jgi:hypothetical protein